MEIIDIITYPQKYVPAVSPKVKSSESPKIVLQIELKDKHKEEVLKAVLGEKKATLLLE